MHSEFLRVGELAKRTGVSVRTLHYYDEIGLLTPAVGGGGGHRLYGNCEIERLFRICSLRSLGMSLDEIRRCLDDEGFTPLRVVELHLSRLTRELEAARRLRDKLEDIARSLRATEEASVADFLQAIERTIMFEKYYTKGQLQDLEARGKRIGEEGMRQAERDWNELFDEFREAMARGDDPASDTVQALSRRARTLIVAFSGGNAGIESSLGNMMKSEPTARAQSGAEPELWEFMARARAAADDASGD